MILHGRNLIIKANGVAIAAARSCSVSIQAEQLPISSPMSGAWASFLNGTKSWSVSTNQLLVTLRTALVVGTQVSLEFCVEGKGVMFGGFTSNPTLESGACPTTPTSIVWDKTRKKFLACLYDAPNFFFYESWEGQEPYTNIEDYQLFMCEGQPYRQTFTWVDGELYSENLSGNANVQAYEAVGTVGNLAQGSFRFMGNGPLSAAELP